MKPRVLIGFVLSALGAWLAMPTGVAHAAEDTVRVIQPKPFVRQGRFAIAPMLGLSLNDPYIQHVFVGASATYHITELFAVGATADYALSATTKLTDALLEKLNVRTALSPIDFMAAANFEYTPIYGKFALVNRVAIHWDVGVSLGLGAIRTTATGYHFMAQLGAALRFHLTRWLTLSFEVRDHLFSESLTVSGQAAGGFAQTFVFRTGLGVFMPFDFATE
ncbi:MAG: outer membrane beta-barrel domain-containing protein [Deltaproteobacteria bacterium]|nr:outer membrane beta-barrel domain-containing protein [Deltaproteobacteria bacterium]